MRIPGAAPSRLLLAASLLAPVAFAGCASASPVDWTRGATLAAPAAAPLDTPAPAAASFVAPRAELAPLSFAPPAPQSPEEPSGDAGFGRSGLYLGAYAMQSYERFDSATGVQFGDADIGAGLKLGYRIKFLAIEAFAEDVKGFEVSSGVLKSDLDLLSLGVAGKFILGDGRIQPYLLAGAGATRADVEDFALDNDGWFARAGVGLDVYITEHFAAFAEANYNRMMGSVSELDYVNLVIGILFRF